MKVIVSNFQELGRKWLNPLDEQPVCKHAVEIRGRMRCNPLEYPTKEHLQLTPSQRYGLRVLVKNFKVKDPIAEITNKQFEACRHIICFDFSGMPDY